MKVFLLAQEVLKSKGSLSAHRFKNACLMIIVKGNSTPLNWLYGNLLYHWFVVFWARNRGKIPQNLKKFVMELPEARVADVTENPLLDCYTTASILTS